MKRIGIFTSIFLLLILLSGLNAMAQTATITPDRTLSELYIEDSYLDLTLGDGETFVDHAALHPDSFILQGVPGGNYVSIESITNTTNTSARIHLDYNRVDFDSDSTNFCVAIDADALTVSSSDLVSDSLTIYANTTPAAILKPDSVLTENRLDVRYVTIILFDEAFTGTVQNNDLQLNGEPDGVTISSVSLIPSRALKVFLDYDVDTKDFDTDSTHFSITITDENRLTVSSQDLPSDSATIFAYVEEPQANLTPSATLYEPDLDAQHIDLHLVDDKFLDYSNLDIPHFKLRDAPPGLSIGSLSGKLLQSVRLNLNFSGDFDVNYPDFHVWIDGARLLQSADSLLSDTLLVTAFVENLSGHLTPSNTLYEPDLNTSYVDISFVDECFTDSSATLTDAYFTLLDAPTGLSIGSVSDRKTKSVRLNLDFTGDFDVDYPDFHVSIDDAKLLLSTSDLLTDTVPITAFVEDTSATLTASGVLFEPDLDSRYIDITFVDECFTDSTSPSPETYFQLLDAPSGLSFTVSDRKTKSVRLNLDYSGDFDVDYPNFHVWIDNSILLLAHVPVLSDTIPVTFYLEHPKAFLTPDASLNEPVLNSRYIDIKLFEEKFNDYTLLDKFHFKLRNGPPGLTIDDISDAADSSVRVNLNFTGDFDNDYPDFHIWINGTQLLQSADSLLSDSVQITHVYEMPEFSITPNAQLTEENLDAGDLTVTLVEDSFVLFSGIQINHFILNNKPNGTSIGSIDSISPIIIRINLNFAGNDFDTNFTQFSVSIDPVILVEQKTLLTSNNKLTIIATDEPSELYMAADQTLAEYNLDGRQLTLTLIQDTFINLPLLPADFTLNKGPLSNLIITGVNTPNKNSTILTLGFTYQDFDTDVTGFDVTVSATKLKKGGALTTLNDSTIHSYTEIPVATITSDSILTEYRFNYRTLDLKFHDEKFIDKSTLVKEDFSLVNKPPETSVGGISNVNDSSITIILHTEGADFDESFPNLKLSTRKEVLLQSGTSDLQSNNLIVYPNHEPNIIGLTIPDQTYKVGDIIAATITLDNNVDSLFTLRSGNIGGYSIDSLKRDISDKDKYYAYFTINEGGTDYPAVQNIPVNNFQLEDWLILGNIWNTPIAQSNDLIDANTPVVTSILPLGSGTAKIGGKVFIVVSADQKGYSVDAASHINSIPVTSPNITMVDNNNSTYTFTYTIQAGDQDVPTGNLQASFVYSDIAGNKNVIFSTVSSHEIGIDANAPVIDSIRIISSDDTLTIGENLILTIYTDEDNYVLDESNTKVNNTPATASNIDFSALGGGRYTLSYQVKEGDPQVAKGTLGIQVILADSVVNKTSPFTTIQNNTVAILTTRPTANLAGTQKICVGFPATLYISFTGTAPWEIEYTDGTNSAVIDNITDPMFSFDISPATPGLYTFQITQVEDATQNTNTGTGSAFVTVNSLPVVAITGLRDVFSVEEIEVPLNGTPPGGDFMGVGVVDPVSKPEYFNPNQAGVEDSPHMIYYKYTDANGCVSTDSALVNVISAAAEIFFGGMLQNTRQLACWYEDDFFISARNTSDSLGIFTTEPSFAGFLTDNLNNTAILHPSAINWSSLEESQYIDIIYHYPDTIGYPLTDTSTLKVEYFMSPRIYTLEKMVYCSNEPAFDLEGNYLTGTFTKIPGVSGDPPKYSFNPGTAAIGVSKIYYTQLNASGCTLRDSIEITVNPTPIAAFNYLDTCVDRTTGGSGVRFVNATDTTGLGSLSWAWNFGDFFNNTSTLENPTHIYQVGGSRTVSLEATTIHGCINKKERVIVFGDRPESGFTWQTECFTTSPIRFDEDVFSEDPLKTYRWRLYNTDGSKLYESSGASLVSIEYLFPERNEYPVELEVETELGCRDIFRDTILLRPFISQITADEPYLEDFEDDALGWYSTYDSLTTVVNSWTFGDVNASGFPLSAASGTKAWFTGIDNRTLVEQSWVSSPCFNLSGLRRPMIRISMKRSFERDRDGAVLQYTTDHGKTWNNIGTLDDGSINWYNSYRIQNGPGEQEQGWTGEITFKPDASWVVAKHELDILRNQPIIQFRIAYGSDGSSVVQNEGFAFDDIFIGERTRLVLLEHFTSAADSACKNANNAVNSLVSENVLDIIDIQYHVGDVGTDKMYSDYPIGPGARSLYYGISTYPHTFFDGGGSAGLYVYDYLTSNLNELNLFTRVLMDPDFNIDIDADIQSGQMNISVDLTALNDLPLSSYTVHAAIIEKEIDDPAYYGAFDQTRFENVVRKMLPDAGGTIFTKEWTKGDKENFSLNWNIQNVLDEDLLYVVVFVQDRDTKQVYQTATNDPDAISGSVGTFMQAKNMDLLVFPNPASELANIAFSEPLAERSTLQVFNHMGALVEICQIESGISIHQLNVQDYKKGVYYLRIVQGNKLVGVSKLMVL